MILPETAAVGAVALAERLRAAVENEPFDIGGNRRIPVTVSIGVAAFPEDAAAEALVAAADRTLYRAKQSGRNRVCRPANDA